jgi:hypothetical protein
MALEIEAVETTRKNICLRQAAGSVIICGIKFFKRQEDCQPGARSILRGQLMLETSQRNEEAVNEDAITTIAQEMHYPLPIVKRVYEAEFARLKASARITDYLVLFAARRTRDALLARQP